MKKIVRFFGMSAPVPELDMSEKERQRYYKKLRYQTFWAATLGYSLYYVCRTGLNVVKKPIIDSGEMDATQLGVIGSALLFAYAIGKFVNGFLADYSNIKRFMATGLLVSALANLAFGLLGFMSGVIPATVVTVVFAVLWGINGWSQSVGSPASVIGLSRWFSLKNRGTYYGFFSASHNIGEFLSFLFVGLIVTAAGWQWGFFGSAIAGGIGFFLIIALMHDTPQSKGLPPVETLTGEQIPDTKPAESSASTRKFQRQALRTPGVWILAAASAFMYISRYAVNGWGVLYLQEQKGFELATATQIISINALLGIFGTILSGWFSDKLFNSNRNIPAFIFGALNSVALVLFIYGGNALWVNILSMVLFGIAIGVLICFLGGLMAVDIVPRAATGAAMGVVGVASYVAAGIQDVVSGRMIDAGKSVVEGVTTYDFGSVALFWIAASVISFLLPVLNWRRTKKV